LVIDDGSKEKIEVEECKEIYSNIKVIELEKNYGIEHALNLGLKYLIDNNYKYAARLDAGDTIDPCRLIKQIEFLNNNQDHVMVGSWVEYFNQEGVVEFSLSFPTEYLNIKKKMHLNSMFSHPSVMIRLRMLKHMELYSNKYPCAEDYELFFRLMKKYPVANMPEFLTQMEVNTKSISYSKRTVQLKSRLVVQLKYFDISNSLYSIYGLIRSLLLIICPFKWVKSLKNKINVKY